MSRRSRQANKQVNEVQASLLIITERPPVNLETGEVSRNLSPRRVQVQTIGESLTKQSDRHEADVNVILSRYIQTGDERHLNRAQGVFADVSHIGDYQECVEVVQEAAEAFADLPANVREAFDNDPALLIAAVMDPNETERLINLGVLRREQPKDSTPEPEKKGAETPAS